MTHSPDHVANTSPAIDRFDMCMISSEVRYGLFSRVGASKISFGGGVKISMSFVKRGVMLGHENFLTPQTERR